MAKKKRFLERLRLRAIPEYAYFSLPDDARVLTRIRLWGYLWIPLTIALWIPTTWFFVEFLIEAPHAQPSFNPNSTNLPANFTLPDLLSYVLAQSFASGLVFYSALLPVFQVAELYGSLHISTVLRRRSLHKELRERGVFMCASAKCGYDCSAIQGNICPECGKTVPGLESMATPNP